VQKEEEGTIHIEVNWEDGRHESHDLKHNDWKLAYREGQAWLDEDRSIESMYLVSADQRRREELDRVDTLEEFGEVVDEELEDL